MSKITLSGRTIGSVQVTSTDRTTIVKTITVGTPIRSVIGAGSTFDGLNDVTISGASNNDFIQFDSSAQKFVNRSAPVFTTIASSLIPSADSTHDLGSAAAKWRDLYLSGSTLNLGDLAIKDQSGTFSVEDQLGAPVAFDLTGSQSQIRGFFSSGGDITYDSSTGRFSIDVEATYTKANFDSDFNTAIDEASLGGTGLSYNSSTNTLSITNTGVDSAVYGSATQIPVLTVNARGQIDSAGTVNVAGVSSTSYDSATGVFTINTADGNSFATTLHDSADRISEIRGALSAGGDLSYNSATGQFTFDVEQVYTKANFDSDLGDASTSNLPEGTNLYYTTARADSDAKNAISGGTGITYNSTTGEITTTDSEIVHDNLSGFAANEHIDHTTVSVVAGKGLTGGGTIAANRTIDIDSANVRGMFSATDAGGDGSFSYNSGTGAFTYTGPSAAEVKAHFQPLDSSANPTFNQVRGPAEFIIDPAAIGDATGTVKILGNLQVEGTQTTINSTTVSINDKNIVIADSAADSSALNGGGITWGGSSIANAPSLTYDHASVEFDLNRKLNVSGDVAASSATVSGNITSGGNRVLTIADEGSGNGLDADTLDGSHASAFATSAQGTTADNALPRSGGTMTGDLTGTQATTSASWTVLERFFANPAAESGEQTDVRLINDLAGFNKWGTETLTDIVTSHQGSTAVTTLGNNPFDGTSSFKQIFQNANGDPNVILLELPHALTYSCWVGIVFGATNWRAKSVKIETYRNGAYQTECDLTNQSSHIVARKVANNDNNGVTKIRITLDDYNNTSSNYCRIHTIFAVNYNAGNNAEGGVHYLSRFKDDEHYSNIAPALDGTYALGTSSKRYSNIHSDAVTVAGTINADSATVTNISLPDNGVATFGTDGDFTIDNDGSRTRIKSLIGNLDIRQQSNDADVSILNDDGTGGVTTYLKADGSEGEVQLYHYGSQKLATKATGVTVTGSLIADSATISGDLEVGGDITATDLTLADTGFPRITMQDLDGTNQKGFIDASAGSFNITSQNNTSHGTINLNRYNGTSTLKSLQTTPDGSVLFYDSASTYKMKWSAPDLELQFQDNVAAEFGDGGDLRILHNGVNSKINNNTGALQITNFADNADVTISTDDGSGGSTNYFRADGSTGKTILYYYGTEKLTTESDGVTVTGSLVADSATISGPLTLTGLTTSTAAIELSGGVSYDPAGGGPDSANDVGIALTTGTRIIGADNGYIRTLLEWNQSNALEIGQSGTALINHTKIFGGTNGVELYESTAKKLETTPYGVSVGGTINADSATISGNLTVSGDLTVDTNTLVVDAANNKVGINVASPQRSFHIVNNNVGVATTYGVAVVEATDAQLDLVSSADGTWGSSINFVEGASTSANTDVWSIARKTTGGAGDGSLHFNFGTVNQHNNSNKMILSNSGDLTVGGDLTVDTTTLHVDAANNRVGIGTVSPGTLLHLDNGSSIGSGSAEIAMKMSILAGTISAQNEIRAGVTSGTNPYMSFAVRETASPYATVERMRITENGDIGIGTTSPSSTLHVAGTLAVDSALTADSVTVAGNITTTGGRFYGSGSSLTSLNADNISSGTVDSARLPAGVFGGGGGGGGGTGSLDSVHLTNGTFSNIDVDSATIGNVNITSGTVSGDGQLDLKSGLTTKSVIISNATTQTIVADAFSGVPLAKLNYNGSLRLATDAYGVDVTGRVNADSADIGILNIDGAGAVTSTGVISFTDGGSSNHNISFNHGSDELLLLRGDGNVYLKSSGNTKLVTSAYGVTVTGTVNADSATISGNLTVSGDLTVSGTTTTINTETINLADNNIVLNSNHTGVPTQSAGITVERGDSTDKVFQWNETSDYWQFDDDVNVTGSVTLDNFASIAGVDPGNPSASANELRVSGYGIMGNRGTIYLTNANSSGTIQLGIGGIHNAGPKMTVLSSGNVGIGTAGPNHTLHVKNDSNQVALFETSLTSDMAIELKNSQGSMFFGLGGGEEFAVGTGPDLNGADGKFVVQSGGNVGIGTTAPEAKLEVAYGTAAPSVEEGDAGFLLSSSNSLRTIFAADPSSPYGQWIQVTNSSGNNTFPLLLNPLGGNVGIGVRAPGEKFEVCPDSDRSAIIGKAHIGYHGFGDYAGFSHIDQNGTNTYSLLSQSNGATYLNAASGTSIIFRNDNSTKMTLGGTLLDIKVPVTIGSTASYTLDGDSAEVASVSQTSIAEFAHASYCGAKFIVTASQGTKRQISELLVTHDGTTAVATEYGTIATDSDLATFDVDISGSDVRLLATGTTATSTRYKVVETLIEA